MVQRPSDTRSVVTPERLGGLPIGTQLDEIGRFLRYVDERGRVGRETRARAVVAARDAGWTRQAIADALGLGVDSVKAILRDTRPRE